MQRHVERGRLLLARHGRLDRLNPARDDDPVARLEQRVERPAVEVLRGQPGHELLRNVQRLDRHRVSVRQPQPRHDDDRRRRRYVQELAQPSAGADHAEVERPARGNHPAAAHVLRERRNRQLLRDLRLTDERAAALPPDEVAVADEPVERGPERRTRDTERRAELPLGRDRLAHRQPLDQVEDAVDDFALLGHVGESWYIPVDVLGARARRSYAYRREVVNTT